MLDLIGWKFDTRFVNQSNRIKSTLKENRAQETPGKARENSQKPSDNIAFNAFHFLFYAEEKYEYENLTFSTLQIFTKVGCFIAGKSPE